MLARAAAGKQMLKLCVWGEGAVFFVSFCFFEKQLGEGKKTPSLGESHGCSPAADQAAVGSPRWG